MTKRVEETSKKLRTAALIMFVATAVAVVGVSVHLGLPWYGTGAVLLLWAFVWLIIEGVLEDKVLVKEFGPWKKPAE
jgi:O-antigen/teichoic acid export membrane protein